MSTYQDYYADRIRGLSELTDGWYEDAPVPSAVAFEALESVFKTLEGTNFLGSRPLLSPSITGGLVLEPRQTLDGIEGLTVDNDGKVGVWVDSADESESTFREFVDTETWDSWFNEVHSVRMLAEQLRRQPNR